MPSFFFRPQEGREAPKLSYDKLMTMIMRLRPSSFVSALDFAAFSRAITGIHERVKERISSLDSLCQELARQTEGDMSDLIMAARPDANFTLPESPTAAPQEGAPGTPTDAVSSFVPLPASPLARKVLGHSDIQRLQKTASAEIVEELQRRTTITDLTDDMTSGLPTRSVMDEELHLQTATKDRNVEAFVTLGVPDDDNDSGTVYV